MKDSRSAWSTWFLKLAQGKLSISQRVLGSLFSQKEESSEGLCFRSTGQHSRALNLEFLCELLDSALKKKAWV